MLPKQNVLGKILKRSAYTEESLAVLMEAICVDNAILSFVGYSKLVKPILLMQRLFNNVPLWPHCKDKNGS